MADAMDPRRVHNSLNEQSVNRVIAKSSIVQSINEQLRLKFNADADLATETKIDRYNG